MYTIRALSSFQCILSETVFRRKLPGETYLRPDKQLFECSFPRIRGDDDGYLFRVSRLYFSGVINAVGKHVSHYAERDDRKKKKMRNEGEMFMCVLWDC